MSPAVPAAAAAGEDRRERNKQQIRARIYAAAVDLFAKKGYDATTIDEIAELADVARGTFFNHFPRKDDLITEWAQDRRRRMLAELELPLSIESSDTSGLLHLCMATLAQVNEVHRSVTETMLAAWVKAGRPLTEEPYTAEVFERIVEVGMQRGEANPRLDPKLVGHLLRDVYVGALYRWAREPGPTGQLAYELRDVLEILLLGITPRAEGK